MAELGTHIITDRDFSRSTKLLPGERSKRKEELPIIAGIVDDMATFVSQYGVSPLPLGLKSIHLIRDLDKFVKVTGNDHVFNAAAEFDAERQSINVYSTANQENYPDYLELALQISHELLHMYSFYSASLLSGHLERRRSGLWARDKERMRQYTSNTLNEAVTEELNKRFDQQFLSKPPHYSYGFMCSVKNRDFQRQNIEDKEYAEDIAHINWDNWHTYSYGTDRHKLKLLIGRIYGSNPDQFTDSEAVFNVFARAYFTGRLLPLARVVESTFGQSSFRRIGRIADDLLIEEYQKKR